MPTGSRLECCKTTAGGKRECPVTTGVLACAAGCVELTGTGFGVMMFSVTICSFELSPTILSVYGSSVVFTAFVTGTEAVVKFVILFNGVLCVLLAAVVVSRSLVVVSLLGVAVLEFFFFLLYSRGGNYRVDM